MDTNERISHIDEALLAAVRRDKVISIANLLGRYAPATLRVCRKGAGSSMTDEDAQNAWSQALRCLDQNDRSPGSGEGLESIVMKQRASVRRHADSAAADGSVRDEGGSGDLDGGGRSAYRDDAEWMALVRYSLLTMTPLQAQAFLLSEAAQIGRARVCDILGVTPASLSQLLLKARRRVHGVLQWDRVIGGNMHSVNRGGAR